MSTALTPREAWSPWDPRISLRRAMQIASIRKQIPSQERRFRRGKDVLNSDSDENRCDLHQRDLILGVLRRPGLSGVGSSDGAQSRNGWGVVKRVVKGGQSAS